MRLGTLPGENFVFPPCRCTRLSLYLHSQKTSAASARRKKKLFTMSAHLSEQEIVRREALEKLRQAGIDPYPAAEFP